MDTKDLSRLGVVLMALVTPSVDCFRRFFIPSQVVPHAPHGATATPAATSRANHSRPLLLSLLCLWWVAAVILATVPTYELRPSRSESWIVMESVTILVALGFPVAITCLLRHCSTSTTSVYMNVSTTIRRRVALTFQIVIFTFLILPCGTPSSVFVRDSSETHWRWRVGTQWFAICVCVMLYILSSLANICQAAAPTWAGTVNIWMGRRKFGNAIIELFFAPFIFVLTRAHFCIGAENRASFSCLDSHSLDGTAILEGEKGPDTCTWSDQDLTIRWLSTLCVVVLQIELFCHGYGSADGTKDYTSRKQQCCKSIALAIVVMCSYLHYSSSPEPVIAVYICLSILFGVSGVHWFRVATSPRVRLMQMERSHRALSAECFSLAGTFFAAAVIFGSSLDGSLEWWGAGLALLLPISLICGCSFLIPTEVKESGASGHSGVETAPFSGMSSLRGTLRGSRVVLEDGTIEAAADSLSTPTTGVQLRRVSSSSMAIDVRGSHGAAYTEHDDDNQPPGQQRAAPSQEFNSSFHNEGGTNNNSISGFGDPTAGGGFCSPTSPTGIPPTTFIVGSLVGGDRTDTTSPYDHDHTFSSDRAENLVDELRDEDSYFNAGENETFTHNDGEDDATHDVDVVDDTEHKRSVSPFTTWPTSLTAEEDTANAPDRRVSTVTTLGEVSTIAAAAAATAAGTVWNAHDDQENHALYEVKGGYHPTFAGEVFCDRFVAITKLGWGEFSIVWLARDMQYQQARQSAARHTQEFVVVKVSKSGKEFFNATKREAEKMNLAHDGGSGGTHIGIPRIIAAFQHKGINGTHMCVAMDLCGPNLLKLITQHNFNGIALPIVKAITVGMLRALTHLHGTCKMIHTDLKPENVLLKTPAAETMSTIVDFQNRIGVPTVGQQFSKSDIEQQAASLRGEGCNLSDIDQLSRVYEVVVSDFGSTRSYTPVASSSPGSSSLSRKRSATLKKSGSTNPSSPTKTTPAFPSKKKKHNNNTVVVSTLQTREYRAPEVVLGFPDDFHTPALDIWSLGCLIFELATGSFLFDPKGYEDDPRFEVYHMPVGGGMKKSGKGGGPSGTPSGTESPLSDTGVSGRPTMFNINACHLSLIMQICGEFNNDVLTKGTHTLNFFSTTHTASVVGGSSSALNTSVGSTGSSPSSSTLYTFNGVVLPKTNLRSYAKAYFSLYDRFSASEVDGLLSFVRATLELDPSKRPTSAELLEHPWLLQE